MKITALFLFLLISEQPSTLLITIYSWHDSITALAYVVNFYHGLTNVSLTGLNSSALADFPQRTHLAPAKCLKAPFLGQSSLIFILHPSHLSLNRTTPVSNNMQTIHSFILLSPPSTNTRCGKDTSVQYRWRTPRLLQLHPIWSTYVYSIEAATRAKFIGSSRSPAAETITR